MDNPTLGVMITTYDRPREIRLTIESLVKHLRWDGPLHFHIADDCSPGKYVNDILHDFRSLRITATITKRESLGANMNRGQTFLWNCGFPYIMMCLDDMVAIRDIDLTSGYALMESDAGVGAVRYDGIIGHALDLHLREVHTPVGNINYLWVDPWSPFNYMYSGRPHLVSRKFHTYYGLFAEGLGLGMTEEDFIQRFRPLAQANLASPKVAILPNYVVESFDHIGHSWQKTKEDIHVQV
jgi:glycosyltransferase involved in cell wall biosynthesis